MKTESHTPNTLPREERLRGRSAVSQLFAEGESGFVYPIRYVWRRAEAENSPTSVLFTVPKKFHKRANKRNLLRRRVKEAYRLQKGEFCAEGIHLALVYSTKEILEYERIAGSVARILSQIREEIKSDGSK